MILPPMKDICDKPLACLPLISYRYRGKFGWVMIGALGHADALKEASRSTELKVEIEYLQIWDLSNKYYVDATPENEPVKR